MCLKIRGFIPLFFYYLLLSYYYHIIYIQVTYTIQYIYAVTRLSEYKQVLGLERLKELTLKKEVQEQFTKVFTFEGQCAKYIVSVTSRCMTTSNF